MELGNINVTKGNANKDKDYEIIDDFVVREGASTKDLKERYLNKVDTLKDAFGDGYADNAKYQEAEKAYNHALALVEAYKKKAVEQLKKVEDSGNLVHGYYDGKEKKPSIRINLSEGNKTREDGTKALFVSANVSFGKDKEGKDMEYSLEMKGVSSAHTPTFTSAELVKFTGKGIPPIKVTDPSGVKDEGYSKMLETVQKVAVEKYDRSLKDLGFKLNSEIFASKDNIVHNDKNEEAKNITANYSGGRLYINTKTAPDFVIGFNNSDKGGYINFIDKGCLEDGTPREIDENNEYVPLKDGEKVQTIAVKADDEANIKAVFENMEKGMMGDAHYADIYKEAILAYVDVAKELEKSKANKER